MDEDPENSARKGLNIEFGRELETSSRNSDSSQDVDAVVPQLSRLSINVNTGNNNIGLEMGYGNGAEDSGDAAIFSRPLHNSNHSFYSDCSSKRKKQQAKLNVNLVRLKPNMSINSANVTHSKRSVNENLTSYMVIRQRSFHGFRRTRTEMKTLPLTDPRDAANSPSNWLHRSKTDLYIEKRRERYINQHQKSGESQIDLDGMTFGYLVEHLPRSRSSGHNASPRQRSHGNLSARSCPPNFRSDKLPPLSINRMKQLIQNDIGMIESHHALSSPGCESPPPQSSARGRVRKHTQSSTCVPLKVWQPSLDCAFYSRQKELTPRSVVNSARQQPSPLK